MNQAGNLFGGTAGLTIGTDGTNLYAVGSDYSFAASYLGGSKMLSSTGWIYDNGLRNAFGGYGNPDGPVIVGSAANTICIIGNNFGRIGIYSGAATPGVGSWNISTQLSSTTWGANTVKSGVWFGSLARYVIGGDNGRIAYSNDYGFNWTYSASLSGTTFGSAQTVTAIVSNTGSSNVCAIGSTAGVGTSSDGITWTYQGGLITAWTSGVPTSAFYGNGIIMVGGQSGKLATSADGVTWTNQAALAATAFSTNTVTSVVYTGTAWVVTSSGGVTAASTDNGVTWTAYTTLQTALGGTTPNTPSILTGLVAGSSGTVMAYGSRGAFAYSADNGATWTMYEGPCRTLTNVLNTKQSVGTDGIRKVHWNGSQFMAVGCGLTASTSPDGVNWTPRNGMRRYYNASILGTLASAVAYSGSLYMVGCDSSRLFTSSDGGATWTYLNTYNALVTGTTIFGLAYGNTRFVGVGSSNRRLSSNDNGATWSTGTIWTTGQANALTFGNGLFAACGGSSNLSTSADGITWTSYQATVQATAFGTQTSWAIGYGNGLFIMVGINGAMMTSPDGVTWTYRAGVSGLGYGTGAIFYDVCWTGSEFVLVGGNTRPIMATSPDGITWTDRTAYLPSLYTPSGFTSTALYGAVSNGTTLVIGGSAGNLVVR